MNHKTWNFLAGLILGIGTTRLYLLSDWMMFVLWIEHKPSIQFDRRTLLFTIALLIPFSVSVVLAPVDTIVVSLRIINFSLFVTQLVKTRSYRQIEFWMGLSIPMGIHVALIALQFLHVLNYVQAPHGFTYNSSIMAAIGFAILPAFPLGATGILLFTVSRTYTGATALVAIIHNRKWLLLPVTGTLIMLFILTPSRFNPSTEIHNRLELVTPDAEWTWYGTGFQQFNSKFDLPTPHNIWVASGWELGILAIPFWLTLTFIIWRYKLIAALPILASGFTTEDIWTWPNGQYAAMISFISWSYYHDKRKMPS